MPRSHVMQTPQQQHDLETPQTENVLRLLNQVQDYELRSNLASDEAERVREQNAWPGAVEILEELAQDVADAMTVQHHPDDATNEMVRERLIASYARIAAAKWLEKTARGLELDVE